MQGQCQFATVAVDLGGKKAEQHFDKEMIWVKHACLEPQNVDSTQGTPPSETAGVSCPGVIVITHAITPMSMRKRLR